ncbi:hypothetical protein IVB34_47790 [Bradyrhizobium sp. 2]|uniref:hypothetical protein n=1 Tax=Bradyrhizobium sp. 2 TaxID=190045 RepID=UPI001FFC228C|nr:hypothetical protein [Bradyrhizobium sp. 2]MCK1465792.1 hypothetical protein [Bradyrhizobium sp. 2]
MNGSFTAVTLSWTSGVPVSVAWTAHGKSVGDPIYLKGSTPTYYNGVFQVESVTDANNFTFIPQRQPTTAPTGSALATKANKNIIVQGGQWDYNYPTVNGSATESFALIGAYAQNIVFRDLAVKNASKYCICFGAVRDYSVVNLYSPSTNSDGVKVYGPAFGGYVNGVFGRYGDDVVSVQCSETGAPFLQYNFTGGGDCIGFKCVNIDAKTLACLAVVYAGLSTEFMYNIEFDGVHGYAPQNACKVASDTSTKVVSGIAFRNVDAMAGAGVIVQTVIVDRLTLDNVAPNIPATATGVVVVTSDGTVGALDIYNPAASLVGFPNRTSVSYAAISGTVYNINVFGAGFIYNGAFLFDALVFLGSGSTVRAVNVSGGYLNGFQNVFKIASGALGLPRLGLNGAYFNGPCVGNISATCDLSINDCQLDSCFNAFLRTTGNVTVNWTMAGNTFGGGNTYLVVVSGTPVINPKGSDVQVDVSATGIARATGNFCYNTNAALGTLGAAGPVTCQGTAANSWRLLGDTTKQY